MVRSLVLTRSWTKERVKKLHDLLSTKVDLDERGRGRELAVEEGGRGVLICPWIWELTGFGWH